VKKISALICLAGALSFLYGCDSLGPNPTTTTTTSSTTTTTLQSLQFQAEIVESNNVGADSAIAVDKNDKIHISYNDAENGVLKYATGESGAWTITAIDNDGSSTNGQTSIGLDSNDKAFISYRGSLYLKCANNASGSWAKTLVDSTTAATGYKTSIALDSSGKPHISYTLYDGTTYQVSYAFRDTPTHWQLTVIDPTASDFSAIDTDKSDNTHISYYDIFNADLKYATNATGSWEIQTLESQGNVGAYSAIALDSNDKVHISYYDFSGSLKYITNASGAWVITTIEAGTVGGYTDIALDANDRPHISYYDYLDTSLKYARNLGVSWETFTVDTGNVGKYNAIALDSHNKPHFSYYHDSTTRADNWLKYARQIN